MRVGLEIWRLHQNAESGIRFCRLAPDLSQGDSYYIAPFWCSFTKIYSAQSSIIVSLFGGRLGDRDQEWLVQLHSQPAKHIPLMTKRMLTQKNHHKRDFFRKRTSPRYSLFHSTLPWFGEARCNQVIESILAAVCYCGYSIFVSHCMYEYVLMQELEIVKKSQYDGRAITRLTI